MASLQHKSVSSILYSDLKRLIVILFLSVTLCYISGYFVMFLLSQQQIRMQVKELIQSGRFKGQYETFIFSAAALRSMMVDSHEFSYNGNMYDIISAQQHDEWVTVRCIRDDREKALIDQFSKYLSGNQHSGSGSGSGNNTTTLFKFLQSVFLTSHEQFTCYRQEALMTSVFKVCIYQSPPSYRFYPPPETA